MPSQDVTAAPMSLPILAVVGLRREARLIASPDVLTAIGGGDGAGLWKGLDELVASRAVRAVVSIGIGGALSAELRVGDWVIADRVVSGREGFGVDPKLCTQLEAAVRALTSPMPQGDAAPWAGEGSRRQVRVFTGAIAAGDVMVVDAAAKAALHAATGALVVDMESHVAARFAAAHGLPFTALRAISDGADRALPKAAQAGMKADGGMDVLAVLMALAREPRQLPALIRTAREAEVAFRQLALLNRHHLLGRLGVGDPDLGQLALDVV